MSQPYAYDASGYSQYENAPFDIDNTISVPDIVYPSFLFVFALFFGILTPFVLLLYVLLPPLPTSERFDIYTLDIAKDLKLNETDLKNLAPASVINFKKEKRLFPVELSRDE
jgi:hypothetical protein